MSNIKKNNINKTTCSHDSCLTYCTLASKHGWKGDLRGSCWGEGSERGVQDMEEEHPFPLRHGHDPRPWVAQSHFAVVARGQMELFLIMTIF